MAGRCDYCLIQFPSVDKAVEHMQSNYHHWKKLQCLKTSAPEDPDENVIRLMLSDKVNLRVGLRQTSKPPQKSSIQNDNEVMNSNNLSKQNLSCSEITSRSDLEKNIIKNIDEIRKAGAGNYKTGMNKAEKVLTMIDSKNKLNKEPLVKTEINNPLINIKEKRSFTKERNNISTSNPFDKCQISNPNVGVSMSSSRPANANVLPKSCQIPTYPQVMYSMYNPLAPLAPQFYNDIRKYPPAYQIRTGYYLQSVQNRPILEGHCYLKPAFFPYYTSYKTNCGPSRNVDIGTYFKNNPVENKSILKGGKTDNLKIINSDVSDGPLSNDKYVRGPANQNLFSPTGTYHEKIDVERYYDKEQCSNSVRPKEETNRYATDFDDDNDDQSNSKELEFNIIRELEELMDGSDF